MINRQRYQITKRITLLAALINVLLAFFKMLYGYLGRSHALFADGVHSLSDLLTDILVLLAAKYSHLEPDHNHPYGHARIETAGTLGLAALLLLAAFGIIWNAGLHLLHGVYEQPHMVVIWIAAISVIVNEILFQISYRVGKYWQSSILIANGWHHRSDAFSSIVVLVGVMGAYYGYASFDAIAAMIVGLFIIKMALQLGWSSAQELVDTAAAPEMVAKIQQQILAIPGVKAIHQLRTRLMAENIFIDVHIIVDPYISVSEGHFIAATVEEKLNQSFPKVSDVVVHVDVEDDRQFDQTKLLPPRKVVEIQLRQAWQNCPGQAEIQSIVLHYLDGKIDVQIQLPAKWCQQAEEFKKCYQQALQKINFIRHLEVSFNLR